MEEMDNSSRVIPSPVAALLENSSTILKNQTSLEDADSTENIDLGDLVPTIAQIFLTIALGWMAGTFKVIGPPEAKGLNIFIGKYSMPSLVFISLATLDFSQINVAFLLGVFIAKFTLFFLVLIIVRIAYQSISTGAMFSMFCTQTNDFAMGLPLLTAVLGADHPYVSYLYLVAPISLVVLNPIGFMILEANKDSAEKKSILQTLSMVMKGLMMNPIIVMTILGLIANFVFGGQPPRILELVLSKLGAAFSSVAPFTLGLGMVGKFKYLLGGNLSTLIILTIIKCIFAPILSHFIVSEVNTLLYGIADKNLNNFSFLYGTFPPALGVIAYATQYDCNVELVAAGIVLCTAVSAPLMYLSAQILQILSWEKSAASEELSLLDYRVSTGSVVSIIMCLSLFIITKKYRLVPHCITTGLLIQSLFKPLVTILASYEVITGFWKNRIHDFGDYSVHFSSTFISVILIFIMLQKPIKKMWIVFCMVTPPLIAAAVTGIQLYRQDTYASVEEELGMDLKFERKLTKVILNSVACIVSIVSLTYVLRLRTNWRQNPESKKDDILENPQVYRHTMLGIFMVCSMVTEMTLKFWPLVSGSVPKTGIFKIMKFLDTVFTAGHGIIIFSVFILDIEDLFKFIRKWVLFIKEKIDGFRKEREIKERKKSATGQFVQMVVMRNNMVTNSMYQ